MRYFTIQPPRDIASLVRFFWVLEGDAAADEPYTHRSMADGCCELIFHYKGRFEQLQPNGSLSTEPYSGVNGPTQQFSRFTIKEQFGIFGVYLYPFAVYQLFGIPPSGLVNEAPDLRTVFGQLGQDLEEQVICAADTASRVRLMTAFIRNRLHAAYKAQPSIVQAILHTINKQGQVNINELAGQFYLSSRQFERNFKTWAGFAPKRYARILRFQAATQEFRRHHKSLTEIAYECGYYDQSHFIHDFKEFSGYHPSVYFAGNNEGTLWKEA